MFSKSINRIRKTIGFRMAAWYSVIFIASCALFFLAGSWLLSSSLRQADQELVRSKLNQYAAQYQKGGVSALKDGVGKDSAKFFVRLSGNQNQTIFLALPSNFYEDDPKNMAKFDIHRAENARSAPWQKVISKDGEDTLEIATIQLPDGNTMQVGKSTEEREDILDQFQNVLLIVLAAVVLTGIAGGSFFTYRALDPVRQLTSMMRSIVATGKMDARVPIGRREDELQELALLFNQMLQRIESLINGMKGSLDNVAHDLRTPVTRLRGSAEAILNSDSTAVADYREALSDCLEEAERVMTMLNTLMDISEVETGVMKLHLEKLNLSDLLEDIVDLYRYVAEEKQISISVDLPENLNVDVDRNRMRQVVANLLDNAIKYNKPGGTIKVTARKFDSEITFTIQDDGAGIAAEEFPKVWDRLYRGDKSRSERGLGLGLSFVKAIVTAHQGSVTLASQPGSGSAFSVQLPISASLR